MTPRAETRDCTCMWEHEAGCPLSDPSPAPAAGGETTQDRIAAQLDATAWSAFRAGYHRALEAAHRGEAGSGYEAENGNAEGSANAYTKARAQTFRDVAAALAASPASGGPSVAEQFAALGWDLASIAAAAAELERLSGMVRANVASRIAAENERDDAVRGYRWTASGGPGVGREEGEWRAFMVQARERAKDLTGYTGAQKWAIRATLETLIAAWDKGRSPAGPPRETGTPHPDTVLLERMRQHVVGMTFRTGDGYEHGAVRELGEADEPFREWLSGVLDEADAVQSDEDASSRAPGAASRDTTTGDA